MYFFWAVQNTEQFYEARFKSLANAKILAHIQAES